MDPWDPSHRIDAWHQYGLIVVPVPPGEQQTVQTPTGTYAVTAGLGIDLTQRCARCAMAVRIGDEVTAVGAAPCRGPG